MRAYPLLPVLAALALAASGLKADASAPPAPSTTPAAAPAAPVVSAPAAPAPTPGSAVPAQAAAAAQPASPATPRVSAPASTGPSPSGASAPAAPLGPALTVTLKDGQTATLYLKSYDRYFLTALNAKGTRFNLPWPEVASVDGPQAGADLGLMRANITQDPAEVDSRVQPLDPRTALERALWPGVVLHGSGFRYDGAHGSFVELAGAEGFGVALALFGVYLNAYPNTQDTNETLPQDMTLAGVAIFAVTWAWDLGFAPQYADRVNRQQGLALEPLSEPGTQGVQLSYRF